MNWMRRVQWKRRAVIVSALILALITLVTWKIHSHISAEYSDTRITVTEEPEHTLAIIVPFRDRFEELLEFIPHMHSFLQNASIAHKIYIINQADKLRFNRAALINIGYEVSVGECCYLAMHDVDLLPLNPLLNYSYPEDHIFHVSSPELHPLYHYSKFVGGILLLTHKHFHQLNGLSNRYWGWGREDDEFYVRIKESKIPIKRPDTTLITTGYQSFRHIHDRVKRPRDNRRYGNQKEAGGHRDRNTGLDTVDYVVTETYPLTVRNAMATVYNVELGCDRSDTPWCENPDSK